MSTSTELMAAGALRAAEISPERRGSERTARLSEAERTLYVWILREFSEGGTPDAAALHDAADGLYPSTDEGQSVTLEFPYPDAKQGLNRWLPLVKWFLAIPHYVVLFFLILAAIVCVIIAWFAILFTGRYPRGLFDFVVGVGRWSNRVIAYAFVLVTDQYPPFRLGP